jgi:hypothetical protein
MYTAEQVASVGNYFDLYSGGILFEFRPGRWLS